jgi:hypothetical protein
MSRSSGAEISPLMRCERSVAMLLSPKNLKSKPYQCELELGLPSENSECGIVNGVGSIAFAYITRLY